MFWLYLNSLYLFITILVTCSSRDRLLQYSFATIQPVASVLFLNIFWEKTNSQIQPSHFCPQITWCFIMSQMLKFDFSLSSYITEDTVYAQLFLRPRRIFFTECECDTHFYWHTGVMCHVCSRIITLKRTVTSTVPDDSVSRLKTSNFWEFLIVPYSK